MLKKFFLNFLSSFVGAWVALGLFIVTIIIVVVGLMAKVGMSAAGDSEKIVSHSVMTLDLQGEIVERETPVNVDYVGILRGEKVPQTLDNLVKAIRESKENKDIDMIYIKCGGISADAATLHALRAELSDFKKSGKKIYAYADAFGNGDYYVASVADSLFMNPSGMLNLTGLSANSIYFKDLLDNLGIKIQVVKVGTFKSAVEPYISNEMSEPARAQLDTLLTNIWGVMTGEICKSRKMTKERLNALIDKYYVSLLDGKQCAEYNLVDRAVYERTMDARIADALNVDKEKVNFVSPAALAMQSDFGFEYGAKNQIAVLYATGEIMEGTKNGINCEVLVPLITELADNDNVKGMVLRVNSPGGSVFGSDQIAEALGYFQSKGKPLAVSMGDYAASGGYWISCHANRIFADPATITGSIGIFGMIPDASGLAHKIGVTPQFVATNPEADFPSLMRPMTETQLAEMQKYIEQGYDRFIKRVATGRKMKESRVRQIAEGRVWDGVKAKELGLVDELGGLQNAMDWVQNEVKSKGGKECEFAPYPELNESFWNMVQLSMQSQSREMLIKEVIKLTPEAAYAIEVANVLRRRSVQARMMPISLKSFD